MFARAVISKQGRSGRLWLPALAKKELASAPSPFWTFDPDVWDGGLRPEGDRLVLKTVATEEQPPRKLMGALKAK